MRRDKYMHVLLTHKMGVREDVFFCARLSMGVS